MGAISFNNKLYPTGGTSSASMSVYDNSDSGLDATNVQDAVDEVVEALDGKQDALTNPLTQSDVVNNLTSTATNVPLSAAMGKALQNKINEVATGLGTKQNITDNNLATTAKTITGAINELQRGKQAALTNPITQSDVVAVL